MARYRWLLAAALELGSVGVVVLLEPAWLALLSYVVLHAAATPLLAAECWHLLPRRYRLPARDSLRFLNGMLFLMPLVGAIGLLWGLVGALRLPRLRRHLSLRFVSVPELPFQPPQVFVVPPYSSGALRQILRFSDRPLKRLKAVMATRHMPVHDAVPVWQIALKDRVDDVRLLAYAMTDGKEKQLTDRIQELTAELDEVPPFRRADCHRQLAQLAWELVYNQLVQGAVRQHWLNAARQHAETALASLDDAPLRLLYVRLLLAQDDRSAVRAALAAAEQAGVAPSMLAPWQAELAFRERRFADIPALLSRDTRVAERGAPLASIRQWWGVTAVESQP